MIARRKVAVVLLVLVASTALLGVLYPDGADFISSSRICLHSPSGSTRSFSFTRAEKIYEELTRLNMEKLRGYIKEVQYVNYDDVRLPYCLKKERRGPFEVKSFSFKGDITFYVLGKDDLRGLPDDNSMVFVTDCMNSAELLMLQSAYNRQISIATEKFVRLFNIKCVPSKIVVNQEKYYVEGF